MMQHQAGFCCRVVGANRPGKAGAWRSAGPSGKVVLKPITLGRDFGDTVEVLMGVEPSEQVMLNPSFAIASGDRVRVATPDAPKAGS